MTDTEKLYQALAMDRFERISKLEKTIENLNVEIALYEDRIERQNNIIANQAKEIEKNQWFADYFRQEHDRVKSILKEANREVFDSLFFN
jgi:uncharacterized coiled-coil protein SlyX